MECNSVSVPKLFEGIFFEAKFSKQCLFFAHVRDIYDHDYITKVFFLPFCMFLQFIENGSITVFEYQVELSLPPKHLDKIDQVGMLQILET